MSDDEAIISIEDRNAACADLILENNQQNAAERLLVMKQTLLSIQASRLRTREDIKGIFGLPTMTRDEFDNELIAIRDTIYGITPEQIDQLLGNIFRQDRPDGN